MPTCKLFRNFRGDERKSFKLAGIDSGFLVELLDALATSGGMLGPHPENFNAVWRHRKGVKKLDLPVLRAWGQSRQACVEAYAPQRSAPLVRIIGAPISRRVA